MIDPHGDPFELMRAQASALLAAIEAWSCRAEDPGHFRHRLLRAHVLALLDEIEQLSATTTAAARPHAAP